MATNVSDHGERRVSIGDVLSRTFGTIGSNPLATLGIAFLFGALPSMLVQSLFQSVRQDAFIQLGTFAAITLGLLSIVVAILLSVITQGALVRATVAYSEGRKASFSESVMAGLRVALPLVLLGLLSSLGIALGLMLLIVPGVILAIMWSVAGPVVVEEQMGPVEALGRSRFLTAGARWKIFGLMLVLFVLYLMLSGAIGLIAVLWYGNPAELANGEYLSMPIGALVITGVLQTLTSAFWGVLVSSLYVELRNWKDGPTAETLAEIFA